MVSEVVQCPTGPYVYIDAPGVDEELLHRYPELVAYRLAEAGQPQAVVAVPEPERLEQLANSPLAVLLVGFTMPGSLAPTTLPRSWIERATAWLQQDSPEQAMMWGIGPWVVEFSVPAAAAAGLLLDFNRTATSCALVGGDAGAVRSVRLEFLRTPWLVLATAGPALDDPARVGGRRDPPGAGPRAGPGGRLRGRRHGAHPRRGYRWPWAPVPGAQPLRRRP